MILTKRLFVREAPSRLAKSIYIFCEGAKREYQYFQYFKELDSRINIEVYKLDPTENNSPLGLFDIAKQCILSDIKNEKAKYSFQKGDEVWIVLDIDKDKLDSRKPQIEKIQQEINTLNNWNLSLSNPCFEVWHYYHLEKEMPTFNNLEVCKNWKNHINNVVKGGYDSRRHPILILDAQTNSENNFESENSIPTEGNTDLFNLSKIILELIGEKISKVRVQIE